MAKTKGDGTEGLSYESRYFVEVLIYLASLFARSISTTDAVYFRARSLIPTYPLRDRVIELYGESSCASFEDTTANSSRLRISMCDVQLFQ